MSAHTPGPWKRIATTIFADMHDSWWRGVERVRNRFTVGVQFDASVEPPANAPVTGTNGKKVRSGMTVRFGRSKGMPIEELELADLLWYIARAEESVDDTARARFREQNLKDLETLQAELKTR